MTATLTAVVQLIQCSFLGNTLISTFKQATQDSFKELAHQDANEEDMYEEGCGFNSLYARGGVLPDIFSEEFVCESIVSGLCHLLSTPYTFPFQVVASN